MPALYEYYSPQELTSLSRALQASAAPKPDELDYFVSREYFVPELVDDIEYRVKAGENGVPHSAKFRAFDTENAIGVRPGVDTASGALQPLGLRELFTEKDKLTIRKADPDQWRTQLAKAAVRTTMGTVVRMERGCVETVATSKLTLANERGLTLTADWGRNPNRTITSITNPWSTPASSNPLADFEAWNTLLDTEVDWLMNKYTFGLLRRSEAFLKLASVHMSGMPDVVTREFVNGQLAAYEVGTIRIYNAKYKNDAGVEVPILPNGQVIGMPKGVGAAVWGVTAEAMDPENKLLRADWPGLTTLHERTAQPKQDWVNTSAIGMPVLADPDKTISIKVTV